MIFNDMQQDIKACMISLFIVIAAIIFYTIQTARGAFKH